MKALVLFPYPVEPDGVSIQGYLLYKGLLEAGVDAIPCHHRESLQKEFYLRHFKPDVVIGIGFWGNVPDVLREPLKWGANVIPWFNADGWVANYQHEFNQLKLMFTTSEWVRSIYDRDGVDISKIVPMHIGIDTDNYRPVRDTQTNLTMRRMLGVRDDELLILTMGGDVTSKGAQEMMHALARINGEIKNWRYICKSWPSECSHEWREKEERLAEELGIREKVTFIDGEWSPEFMSNVLNACDIYAAPSRIEGFGMIQAEAMSCAKPVVSIDKGGPSEFIENGKTGFLARVDEEVKLTEEWAHPSMGYQTKQIVKFDTPKTFGYRADIDDLEKYTKELMLNPELRRTLGENARRYVLENLDYRVIAKKMLRVIEERLGIK